MVPWSFSYTKSNILLSFIKGIDSFEIILSEYDRVFKSTFLCLYSFNNHV
jgi:hypothetical protein